MELSSSCLFTGQSAVLVPQRKIKKEASPALFDAHVTSSHRRVPSIGQILRPACSQYGSRNRRLKILPESSRGNLSWISMCLGTLKSASDALSRLLISPV